MGAKAKSLVLGDAKGCKRRSPDWYQACSKAWQET